MLSPVFTNADETKFALFCEWHHGTMAGSQTFHVNLKDSTVDGKRAAVSENTIYFVKNAVEYTINRSSGVLTWHDLKPESSFRLDGPRDLAVHRCQKISNKRF